MSAGTPHRVELVEELVDVIDDDGRVVGVVPRSVMRRDNLFHRSVAIVVRSSSGQVLVHRRAETKDVWPGRWDLAVGGVVASGEDVTTAAHRELAEEVGIEHVSLAHLGVGDFRDESVRCRCSCFEVVSDGPVRFADGEVVEARWVEVDELAAMVASVSFVPDSTVLFGHFRPEFFADPGTVAHI